MSPKQPSEGGMPQHEVLLRLRAAIDTAIKYPSQANADTAISIANAYPQALRSSHLSHNLGVRRWQWLNKRGVTPVGESVEIAGTSAIKGTITPEVKK